MGHKLIPPTLLYIRPEGLRISTILFTHSSMHGQLLTYASTAQKVEAACEVDNGFLSINLTIR